MNEEERKALKDFEDTVFDRDDMQQFVNTHRSYCHYVAIDAHVKYVYLLLNDFANAPVDDKNRFLNKIYENHDLMEEND
ncbi:hypothetical protein [Schleiferilactobacillus harbinensis]|uniref:hypothetical protein n=1 Tax=Schleiferilactobacillus harbinensis TaxID=304207 RepID=UPI00116850F3|nr:hypothetical protein [Schleiferilactobacillus harbinensis]GEK06641.1 hypothetical protein LHA01_18800 [Schleiferilactobacillus harbinensis]